MSTYLDRSLLETRPDFDSIRSGTLDDFTFEALSAGTGTPWKPTTGPKRTITYPFRFTSREQAGNFRIFFSEAAGRRQGFWLPVYLLDYKLTADASAGDSSITVESVDLAAPFAAWPNFKHLVLCTWEALEAAEISGVVSADGVDTITLSAPLVNDWPKNSTICGGLIFARALDDELVFRVNSLEASECTVRFVELPSEYTTAHTGSAPVYLYEITRGGQTWRYADCFADIDAGGHTWTAADITHGEIAAGIEFVSNPVELQIATDDPTHPMRALLDRTLMLETYVTIYETDLDTLALDTSEPVHKGRIEEWSADKRGVMRGQISSIDRIAELLGPRPQIQRTCNHRTYDDFCGLNAADYTTAGTITAISADPAYVEATEFGDKATTEADANWFALGRVTSGVEVRQCVGQSSNRLYLSAPFRSALVGDAISALAGDDRRAGTCANKFSNIANFLGCPYVPNKNPQFEALETPKPSGGKKG